MTILRLDHTGAVVDDLDGAIAFFVELGMEIEGQMPLGGPTVDALNGLDGIQVDIAMLRTPDGHSRLELTRFHTPAVETGEPHPAPPNTLGLRNIMFAVDDIDDAIARLRGHGAELIGELVQYEDTYRLCYLRGPGGMIVALAQDLR